MMKNKHITLMLLAGAIILALLFWINNWIRTNSARQEIGAVDKVVEQPIGRV